MSRRAHGIAGDPYDRDAGDESYRLPPPGQTRLVAFVEPPPTYRYVPVWSLAKEHRMGFGALRSELLLMGIRTTQPDGYEGVDMVAEGDADRVTRAPKTKRMANMTSEKRITTAQRRADALRLRAAGASYRAIGETLNVSTTRSWELVDEALREHVAEGVAALRELECRRLDQLQMACWPAAMRGIPRHIDSVLRVMQRRSRLLGLDAPREVAITGDRILRASVEAAAADLGLNPAEVMAEAEALLRRIQGGA